jgi:hypothetical protein
MLAIHHLRSDHTELAEVSARAGEDHDFLETGLPRRLLIQFALLTAGGRPGHRWRYRNGYQGRRDRCGCLRRGADGTMMSVKDARQGVAKIAQKMPAIRNLDRTRGKTPGKLKLLIQWVKPR